MSEELQHLWIPDEEVEQLDKKLRGDSEDRGLDHSAHGETLSTGLRNIVTAYSHLENDSLSDEDIMIFKMVLPETEEIYSKRDIAEKEGLKINAVQDKHSAVVSTNKKMFTRLQERVGKYRETGGLKYFQYVDQFEPITAEDKRSKGLSRFLGNNKEELHVDVQIMLVPNLEEDMRAKAVSRLEQEIRSSKSVSIHIRRGDYVSKGQGSTADTHYYINAIMEMNKRYPDARYFVFSDDIPWCKEYFSEQEDVLPKEFSPRYVQTGAPAWTDMYLMSKCKHNIICDSTFSWWGGWLNGNQEKTVLVPEQWLFGTDSFRKDDVFPSEWIRVSLD